MGGTWLVTEADTGLAASIHVKQEMYMLGSSVTRRDVASQTRGSQYKIRDYHFTEQLW